MALLIEYWTIGLFCWNVDPCIKRALHSVSTVLLAKYVALLIEYWTIGLFCLNVDPCIKRALHSVSTVLLAKYVALLMEYRSTRRVPGLGQTACGIVLTQKLRGHSEEKFGRKDQEIEK